MVHVEVEYKGELRCEAVHGPSQGAIETDAPVDNHGKGEAFSPTDLVGTAMATCIATVLAIGGEPRGWDLTGLRLKVEKHMATSGIRRIARLPLEIYMPILLEGDERTRAERIAHTCPVHQSLHPDIDAPITFHWPEG